MWKATGSFSATTYLPCRLPRSEAAHPLCKLCMGLFVRPTFSIHNPCLPDDIWTQQNKRKKQTNKKTNKQVAVEAPASRSSFSATDTSSTAAASLKENDPRLITTCLRKPQRDVINFFLRCKRRKPARLKVNETQPELWLLSWKGEKKRTFRPQLVSADGSLLWRAITQMLSIIDTGKSFGLTLFFGYGFNCPEYEVWGPLTYHINGSE